MSFPYDNTAFPFTTSPAEVVSLLRNEMSRAVMLREHSWEEDLKTIHDGIHFTDSPPADYEANKLLCGSEHTGPMTADNIHYEAAKVGVGIDPHALHLLTHHCNYLREMFVAHFTEFTGDADRKIIGRLFFNPVGGRGIAPLMHVDDREMVLHSTFKGAALSIHTGGALPDYLWMRMNRDQIDLLLMDEHERIAHMHSMRHSTEAYMEEFSHAALGDAVIMRGQYGRNLMDPAVSRTVCVHASSPLIPVQGQAAVAFYPKMG